MIYNLHNYIILHLEIIYIIYVHIYKQNHFAHKKLQPVFSVRPAADLIWRARMETIPVLRRRYRRAGTRLLVIHGAKNPKFWEPLGACGSTRHL